MHVWKIKQIHRQLRYRFRETSRTVNRIRTEEMLYACISILRCVPDACRMSLL